ncbi:UNVERIFIED_CONTAM: hypothetical protein GTU68_056748 [Idotea baltica]|nr:hypothetical protein [Idotea baltica]
MKKGTHWQQLHPIGLHVLIVTLNQNLN